MQIGIYTNTQKDKNLSKTLKLATSLEKKGASVLVYGEKAAKSLGVIDAFTISDIPVAMLVLGGDGTILNIVDFCAAADIPILGINLGRVGFLTGLEDIGIAEIFNLITNKNTKKEQRCMLEIEFNGKSYLALNEVALNRKLSSKMLSVNVSVDNNFVAQYNADGFIVATPTGSTAYSLSAGGPIIAHNADCFALTAICPHTLNARPMVVASNSHVTLTSDSDAIIIIDGKGEHILRATSHVYIKKAPEKATFIAPDGLNFFTRLQQKLNIWGRVK